MEEFNTHIDTLRMQTSLQLRQLIGDEILGVWPHTDVITVLGNGLEEFVELPARVFTSRSSRRRFPFFKASFVTTSVLTYTILSFFVGSDHLTGELSQTSSIPASSQQASSVHLEEPLHSAAQELAYVRHPPLEIASSVPVAPVRMIDTHRGVYLTPGSIHDTEFLDHTIAAIVESHGSSIVFDVKGSAVFFSGDTPLADELGLVKPMYDLPTIIEKAHRHGLRVIGRFVSIKDHGLTTAKPSTRIRHPKSNVVLSPEWVDPINPDALAYNAEVVCALAKAGIDEINLDYIRFSTAEFGALKAYSMDEKADRVEQFIRAMRETIDRCGPSTKLGLSTFAILGWNYEQNVATLGQDVKRFAPLVDVISPMAYPATFTAPGYYNPQTNTGSRMYHLVYRTLIGYRDLLGPEHSWKLRPWIQGYGVTVKNVHDQIQAVYDAGYCGYQVWNANNAYGPVYTAMKAEQEEPEICR